MPSGSQMYHKIQAMIFEVRRGCSSTRRLQVRATRKDVKGFQLNPTQMFFDMETVSLTK